MKKALLLLFVFFFTSIHAQTVEPHEVQDEVARVDQLIDATKASLSRLTKIRSMLLEYKKAVIRAVKDPKDTDNLLKLVNLAKDLQDEIEEGALQDYFTPQFIEELKKFSQISDKKNIPQAK